MKITHLFLLVTYHIVGSVSIDSSTGFLRGVQLASRSYSAFVDSSGRTLRLAKRGRAPKRAASSEAGPSSSKRSKKSPTARAAGSASSEQKSSSSSGAGSRSPTPGNSGQVQSGRTVKSASPGSSAGKPPSRGSRSPSPKSSGDKSPERLNVESSVASRTASPMAPFPLPQRLGLDVNARNTDPRAFMHVKEGPGWALLEKGKLPDPATSMLAEPFRTRREHVEGQDPAQVSLKGKSMYQRFQYRHPNSKASDLEIQAHVEAQSVATRVRPQEHRRARIKYQIDGGQPRSIEYPRGKGGERKFNSNNPRGVHVHASVEQRTDLEIVGASQPIQQLPPAQALPSEYTDHYQPFVSGGKWKEQSTHKHKYFP